MMIKRIEWLLDRASKISLAFALMLFLMLLNSSEILAAVPKVQVLIMFNEQPGPAEQALVHSVGGEIKYTYSLLPTIAASVPEAALAALSNNPQIAIIELDGIALLTESELNASWGVKRIGAGQVHDGDNRGFGVKIGILDTGIDLNHTDLNYDISCSFNFVESETLDDGHGHGTHVAGIVAALENDTGVVGVAPEATLCVYKVFDSFGNANYSDIIAAIERAVFDDVDITNNSWGDRINPGINVYTAFDNAYTAGVLHVAGAGNSGNRGGKGENCIYPALWDMVIATAATNSNDSRDRMSSTCPELELSAPGALVYSTTRGGGYGYKSGTSMASPHVAGTAALVLAANPEWSNADIRTQLQATAEYLGAHNQFGFGLVDADEAVAGSANSPPVANDQSVITAEDTAVGITLTGSDPDGNQPSFIVVSGPVNGTLSGAPPNLIYTPNENYNGDDTFNFVADDGQYTSSEATVTLTITAVNDPPEASFIFQCSALDCDFDATGSFDVDGTITGYSWDFGSTGSGSVVTMSHTFSASGTYSVVLTVTNDEGASGSLGQDVTVSDAGPTLHVAGLAVSRLTRGPWNRGQVVVTVVDQSGSPVIGASVAGEFTLLIPDPPGLEPVSGLTGDTGQVTLTSSKTRTSGEWQFCVTSLTASGYTYEELPTCDTS